ncbi:4-alpha-glucanotransferase [Falsiroseomonas oryzae]|uniref:4-alpha-glucanotransferase n=1 Tax=Falsiroseomonas oryzae TaxID=2766473 RepID=UPI0022EAEFAD|nr:4-alpha-glucanotransferase [Roseomonas sp. MO-31]
MTEALDRLAASMGIEPEYRDVRGETVRAEARTKRLLLAAMGVPAEDEAAARAALERLERDAWRNPLPPVAVVYADGGPGAVEVTLPAGTHAIGWRIALEDGAERGGQAGFGSLDRLDARELDGRRLERRRLLLPPDLPWGYHRLSLDPGGATASLIVTPGRCWLPPAAAEGRRLWGVAAQLYLLQSATDWGIGDFGDLRRLTELCAARGADIVGLNPLHALFTDNPEAASPYSPASRLLLNVLNIAVAGIPEFAHCPPARALLETPAFCARLDSARAASLVDYTAVAELKLEVLHHLFAACRDAADRSRWQDFAAFREAQGAAFARSCLFLALREHFAARDPALADWRRWPAPFRDPDSPDIRRFAQDHADRVDFHAWLQWVADEQLGRAAQAAAGMEVGLYRDLAVGADSAGAETWTDQAAVLSGVQVGAPRDIFNPAGQDWGLPPFHPRALRAEGYRSFIELVRANMRHAGGLRIDHVMGLQHLFCIPSGCRPAEGAYIAYPLDDLVGILALESQRARCLVVGEDLGTVPGGFRERMAAAGILSYRILSFEQEDATGAFHPPEAYPRSALAVLGSHDLPTMRGWWEGRDIALKARYGLVTDAEAAWQRDLRARDRAMLLEALRTAGLLGPQAPDIDALSRAAHGFLARSAALLAVAQLDDLLDEPEQVNVPSTILEHPNWRRRHAVPVEALSGHPGLETVAAIFRAERGRPAG